MSVCQQKCGSMGFAGYIGILVFVFVVGGTICAKLSSIKKQIDKLSHPAKAEKEPEAKK